MQTRIHNILNRIATIGSTFAWVAIAIITFIDVIGREIFSRPIPGGYEIIQLLMSVGVFFSFPLVALCKGHVKVDLFTNLFSDEVNRFIDVLAKLTSILFFGVLAYALYLLTIHAYSTNVITFSLKIPHWAVITLMTVFMILTTLASLVAVDKDEDKTSHEATDRIER